MKIFANPNGYIMWITDLDSTVVQIVHYYGLRFEITAVGITNRLPNGKNVLFLEVDKHTITERNIMKHLTQRGIPFFLLAKTKNGYHLITRVYAPPTKIHELCIEFSEWLGWDKGYCKLAEIRKDMDFSQILRVSGKYKEKDITVVRWTDPINEWERRVLNLYMEHANFRTTVSRISRGCAAYEPAAEDEALEKGREIHREVLKKLKFLGYETEVSIEMKIGNITIEGRADAVGEDEVIEVKPPVEKEVKYGLLQALIYAKHLGKARATVMDYNLRVLATADTRKEGAPTIPPHAEKDCEGCMLKGICGKVVSIGEATA